MEAINAEQTLEKVYILKGLSGHLFSELNTQTYDHTDKKHTRFIHSRASMQLDLRSSQPVCRCRHATEARVFHQ